MNISRFAVNRPITTLMTIICVVVLGLISVKFLPLNALPDVSFPSLSVYAQYNSSSSKEVEKLITIPLEDVLGTLTHLKGMSSESSNNSSRVRLELETGSDMDLVAMEVRDKIDQIRNELPSDLRRIRIYRFQPTDMPIMVLTVSMEGDKGRLYDLVDNVLIRQLERIEGVGNVEVMGKGEREIFVEIDQDRLKAYGIDLYSLYQSIRDNNQNISAGYVYDAGKKYTIRVVGEYQRIDEIGDTPIRGHDLKLSEVADVKYDFPEEKWFRRLNGNEATMIAIRKSSVANTVEVSKRVKEKLAELENDPRLGNFSALVYRDQSEEIKRGIKSLWRAGALGAIFAALVLFFFLRKVRSTLIIELSVPISIIVAFFIMYISRTFFNSSISLNMVSLSGLMVCVGILLDNSVVVLENIYRHKQEGVLDGKKAAIKGAGEVSLAVVAATMTTIIVFVPMVFMNSSHMMMFMKDFGTVVCVALFSSLMVALSLVPLLSSRFFVGTVNPRLPFIVKMMELYKRIMGWSLRWRFTTILLALSTFALSYYVFTKVERTYSTSAPVRELDYRVQFPRSYSISNLNSLFENIEQILLSRKDELDIKDINVNFGIGRSGGRRGGFRHGSRMTIYLKDIEESKNETTLEVQEKIDNLLPRLPGITYRLGRMRGHGGRSHGLQVNIKGPNPDVLAVYAEKLKEELAAINGIRNVETNLESGDDEINLFVNRELAQQYGVTPRQVASTVFSALSSRATTYFKSENGEIPITVHYREEDRANIRDLENMVFENTEGEMIPVTSLVDYKIKKGPESIKRDNRQSVVEVEGTSDRIGVIGLRADIEDKIKDFSLPPGYILDLGRSFSDTREFEKDSLFAILMAIALIYIIMAALFESLITPFTIIFSVPFALLGVFIILFITQKTLNDMAVMGILILMGIVVNNGIILVDFINQLRRKGVSRTEAILQGGSIRLRPILMTASTTILGILPMTLPIFLPSVFGPAEGRASMYGVIGLVIIGGLSTSTILTLIITPTVYSIMDDVSNGFHRLLQKVFA